MWRIWPFDPDNPGIGSIVVQLMIFGLFCWPFDAIGLEGFAVLIPAAILRVLIVPALYGLFEAATWKDEE